MPSSSGEISSPSSPVGADRPASLVSVGTKSRLMIGVSTIGRLDLAGPANDRRHAEAAFIDKALAAAVGRVVRRWSAGEFQHDRPPLSDVKMTMVFSSRPASLIFLRIRPTQSSMVSIMAA